MNKQNVLLMLAVTGLLVLAGSLLTVSGTAAAPAAGLAAAAQAQDIPSVSYTSVSALTFNPVNEDTLYSKDLGRQILSLAGPVQAGGNIFLAPLALPDRAGLAGLAIYGEDFDSQGAVTVRLKRCDLNQARCLNLAEASSTAGYAAGPFEMSKVTSLNEAVDNSRYNYLLELELTTQPGSGLRSARLQVGQGTVPAPPAGEVQPWSLSGDVRSFVVPNTGFNQVRVCTGDFAQLPNQTHFPSLVVDNQASQLTPNTCVTVWGSTIEIRRPLNTGPSAGTYQILR